MARHVTVEQFTEAARTALGERLVSLVLYGSVARGAHVPDRSDVNTLLICDVVDEALFARLEPAVRAWTRAGHPAPLIFTEREWRESADAFPIEYDDIRQHHRVLAGRDPWAGIRVDPQQARRQLEQELKGKLVRLRQAYATFRGDRKRLAQVLVRSGGGFFTMLRAALRLAGKTPSPAADALVRDASAVIGFAADPLAPLVAYATGGRPLQLVAGDPLPIAYLEAIARTAEFVHRLAQGANRP
jgi:predicted nucleotidyltransferase